MMSKLERAKTDLRLSKLKTQVQEKKLKILESEENISRIQIDIDEYKKMIMEVETILQGE